MGYGRSVSGRRAYAQYPEDQKGGAFVLCRLPHYLEERSLRNDLRLPIYRPQLVLWPN